MGSFAIIQESKESLQIHNCQLNLWSLSGLFGRRIFLWDVGLVLEASEDGEDKKVSKIGLLLPFRTESDAFKDLSKEILDPSTAQLLFGKSINITQATKTIEYAATSNKPPLRIVPIMNASLDVEFEKDKHLRRANLSLWILKFAAKITNGQRSYIRVRFRMQTLGRTWTWMQGRKGALVDIRVADIREIVIPTDGGARLEAYAERFVPISSLRAFVIVPGYLQFRATSPELHYMRLFEGRVWEKYLGERAVNLSRSEKLMIYQWRQDSLIDTKANKTDPFRAFLVLTTDSRFLSIVNHLVIAILVLVGIVLVLHPELAINGYRSVADFTNRFRYAIGGVTALGVLTWFLKNFEPLRKGFRRSRKFFRDFEDWIFRLRAKFDI